MHRFRFEMLGSATLICAAASAATADVILQYFESRWDTIERRMPDVFATGYSALWTPPPGRGDTGPGSVGYDVYDRFNLGSPSSPTQYGTAAMFGGMVDEAHRAGVSVFVDLIVNHNGFRDHTTPGFGASGGYPGFTVSLPGDAYGDFHDPSAGGRYEMRLSGLIDIAQEKNHVYIRHPVDSNPANLPNAVIRSTNYALYPDLSLPPNALGIHPFNTSDPLAGDPVTDNATGVLLRYVQWMLDVQRVDGFRIDAAKHVPEWFFDNFYDNVVWQRGRAYLDGSPTTPYSFCEVFDGDYGVVGGYIRKDGFGNRDALDFPLFFAMNSFLNANGFNAWNDILATTIDASDGSAFDGSRGVSFVSSHDNGPPQDDNLGHAFILTKTGYPLVYFNAGEFGPRSFPQPGRGDALGGQFGDLAARLVDIHNEYARDAWLVRVNQADVLIYERNNVLLVGLNDNGDISQTRYDERTVQTAFDPDTRLQELTGNASDPAIDPTDQISSVLVVGADRRVTMRVPRNINRRGFVMYGPARPVGVVTLEPTASFIEPDAAGAPLATRRLTRIPVVTGNFDIRLQTSDADPLDPHEDDNAVFRIDGGGDYNGNGQIDMLHGVGAGCEQFVTQRSPLHGGGTGTYVQSIDAGGLDEGTHYLKVIAFRHRTGGGPIFEAFRVPFYVDRAPPAMNLLAPTNTGHNDITTRFSQVRVRRADRTASAVHVITDRAITTSDAAIIALANSGNRAARTDRDDFTYLWNFIDSGYHTLFVVAFEESGRATVLRRAGIHANNGFGGGPGDMNGDGAVNNFDIDPFVAALIGDTFNFRADCNGDGRLDNFDIDAFVEILLGG
ncbi:MAG: hypothetical protein JNG88_02885 [Phycisphaerales bacterium]|nr:hypothetical protein [Phycisphaerales bacterium]